MSALRNAIKKVLIFLSCRFTPTCSQYALEAIEVHGIFKGCLLAAWRILRCNPFSKGGWDPVPPKKTKEDK
mgnify:CR=1 FL=1